MWLGINNDILSMKSFVKKFPLLMGFQDVAFPPSRASPTPHYLKIVLEVKTLEPPQVLKLWLGVNKGMLPAKYFHSKKASFYVS